MSHVERVNPRTDTDFVALVDELATAAIQPEDLEVALRATHPGAAVHRSALSGAPFEVWYVYRDGSWTAPEPDA